MLVNFTGSTLIPLCDYSTIVCRSTININVAYVGTYVFRLWHMMYYGKFFWSSFKPAISISLRYFMKVLHDMILTCYISRIPFRMFNFLYQMYSDVCSSCSVYTFFREVFIANHPFGFDMSVKIHTVVLSAGGLSSALNTLDPFWSRSWKFPNIASELRMTWYRSLLTSATFCQCVQLQPYNITIMPLSWAYGCHVKEHTLGVLIEAGLQNCKKCLRNSIMYSTSCETNNHIPSTAWCHWLLIAYTSMPPPYLHSVS